MNKREFWDFLKDIFFCTLGLPFIIVIGFLMASFMLVFGDSLEDLENC